MANTESTNTTENQAPKYIPEAQTLADAILKFSGSNLRNYTMPSSRQAILSAAQKGIDDARAPLLSALQGVLDSLTQNKTFPADIENARRLARDAISEVKARVA